MSSLFKILIAFGIIIITVSLMILVSGEIYTHTKKIELAVAVGAVIVVAFAYLSSKVFANE